MDLGIREASEPDYKKIVRYFRNATPEYLNGMGVDPALLPDETIWLNNILRSHRLPENQKEIFYLIWIVNGIAIGHSNINKIIFGQEGYMHLHMWDHTKRHSGLGVELLKKCIPIYFKKFDLQVLKCEPYALNVPPNKTLPKLGFDFVKEYHTKPGLISFPQPVNHWQLSRAKFLTVSKHW